MTKNLGNANSCPTRIDGVATLFAHTVSRSQCQSRQRDSFHKCFTCVHNNAYAAAHGDGSANKAKSKRTTTKASATANG